MAALTNILKINPLCDDRCVDHSPPHGRCVNRIPQGDRQAAWEVLEEVRRLLQRDTGSASRETERLLRQLAGRLLCNRHLVLVVVDELVFRWVRRLMAWEYSREPFGPPRPLVVTDSSSSTETLTPTSSSHAEAVLYLDLSGLYDSGPSSSSSPRASSIYTIRAYPASNTQDNTANSNANPPIIHSHSASDPQNSPITSSTHPNPRTSMPEAIYPFPLPSSVTRPSPSLSHSTASPPTTATNGVSTAVTKSRYSVARRLVEGDCGICMLPFSVDPNNPSPRAEEVDGDGDVTMDGECDGEEESPNACDESDGEPLRDGEECDDEDDDDDDEDEDENDEDGEDDSDDDTESIVWCKVRCGTNYHRPCLNKWIDMFKNEAYRRPTCPTCRAIWKD